MPQSPQKLTPKPPNPTKKKQSNLLAITSNFQNQNFPGIIPVASIYFFIIVPLYTFDSTRHIFILQIQQNHFCITICLYAKSSMQ